MSSLGGTAATLTIGSSGNNRVKYTAKKTGTAGNSIRVAHVVSGASTPLTVAVSGNDITVNVATTAGSAAKSTAEEVATAVNSSSAARALISRAALVGPGKGVVSAQALTNLTGGTN